MAKITTRPAQPSPNEHILVVTDHELQMLHRGLAWDTHCKVLDRGADDNMALYTELTAALSNAGLPRL